MFFQNDRVTCFDNVIRNVQRLVEAIAIVRGSEARDDYLINNSFANDISQRSFKPVTNFDSNFSVLNGGDNEKAIVHAFLTQLPPAECLYSGSLY